MSEPTYRIEVQHDPHLTHEPWTARIYRLSDDAWRQTAWGETKDAAILNARGWIALEDAPRAPVEHVYANESGDLLPPATS
jgi:hypothetical protein